MTPQELKDSAEFVAIAAGGFYFAYRFATGYFITNLSLQLTLVRQLKAAGRDYLVVKANLSKGGRGSLDLHDAQVKAVWPGGETISPFAGIDRRSFNTVATVGTKTRKVVAFDRQSEKKPLLRLTPGEKVEFSCLIEVPHGEVCTVQVVVLGVKPNNSGLVGQWRSSAVSLPIP
jgi:hypothetical protein